MTKLIKEKINTIIDSISSKKEVTKNTQLPNHKRIVHSKNIGSNEYDYFSGM